VDLFCQGHSCRNDRLHRTRVKFAATETHASFIFPKVTS
jgi:hypothetical protein